MGNARSLPLDASISSWQNFPVNQKGVFGFRFRRYFSDPTWRYGVAELTLKIGRARMEISRWAYEDTFDEAISVGVLTIPEPTSASLGLLALGAVGLRRWRKETS